MGKVLNKNNLNYVTSYFVKGIFTLNYTYKCFYHKIVVCESVNAHHLKKNLHWKLIQYTNDEVVVNKNYLPFLQTTVGEGKLPSSHFFEL